MKQPKDHHLAELSLGILKYDWDGPRVRGFVDGLDMVNAIAQRTDGFVWQMDSASLEQVQLDRAGPMGVIRVLPQPCRCGAIWHCSNILSGTRYTNNIMTAGLNGMIWNSIVTAVMPLAGRHKMRQGQG